MLLQAWIERDPSGKRRLSMQLTRARANMRRHLHLSLYRLRHSKEISHFSEEYALMMRSRSTPVGQPPKQKR